MLNIELRLLRQIKEANLKILQDENVLDLLQFKLDTITQMINEEFNNFYDNYKEILENKTINALEEFLNKWNHIIDPKEIHSYFMKKYDNEILFEMQKLVLTAISCRNKENKEEILVEVSKEAINNKWTQDDDNANLAIIEGYYCILLYNSAFELANAKLNPKIKKKIESKIDNKIYKVYSDFFDLIKNDVYDMLYQLLISTFSLINELKLEEFSINNIEEENNIIEKKYNKKDLQKKINTYKDYNKLLLDNGFKITRQRGSHKMYTKEGTTIPIPQHKLGIGLRKTIDKEIKSLLDKD